MQAEEIMNSYFVALRPTDSARAAADAMRNEGVGIVCVCDELRRPIGVVTDRDIVLRVCAKGLLPENTPLQTIMSVNPITCTTDTSIENIKRSMSRRQVGRLLVLDDAGELVGLVGLAEIWHHESPLSAGPISRRVTERELRGKATSGHTSVSRFG